MSNSGPRKQRTVILGGGVTGLAAGLASGSPVFEALDAPGGICSSYYMRPGQTTRLRRAPKDGEAYRFEIGGGHWIFGGEPSVLNFLHRLVPMKRYSRRSSIYIHRLRRAIPYPLQNHLRYLNSRTAGIALRQMEHTAVGSAADTMSGWLEKNFGSALYRLFFKPFHERYTAGLYTSVAPQDPHKSPLKFSDVKKGMLRNSPPAGYNVSYLYPQGGLDALCRKMASRCDITYGKTVQKIDVKRREIHFEDSSALRYDSLLTTFPLNKMMELASLKTEEKRDPYTSVLVLNIGAARGAACPDDHWVYTGDSRSGFHRVGFYSNVDSGFLPRSARKKRNRVALYVERAYANGKKPSKTEIDSYTVAAIKELQSLGTIGKTDIVDPTWIDVGYTWSYPGSRWKETAIKRLETHGIRPVGRYGLWKFQGIAESIRDGLREGKGQ